MGKASAGSEAAGNLEPIPAALTEYPQWEAKKEQAQSYSSAGWRPSVTARHMWRALVISHSTNRGHHRIRKR